MKSFAMSRRATCTLTRTNDIYLLSAGICSRIAYACAYRPLSCRAIRQSGSDRDISNFKKEKLEIPRLTLGMTRKESIEAKPARSWRHRTTRDASLTERIAIF